MANTGISGDLQQIFDKRLTIDFDTYDTSVSELFSRYGEGRINISPDYQRLFVWDHVRQSRLIESLLLGIPVPDLFMAYDIEEGDAWEVVDGVQRVTSIIGFLDPNHPDLQEEVRRKLAVKITGLKVLTSLNGKTFDDLDNRAQNFLRDRYLKIVLLNDKSASSVKYELFERLNTGGIRLEDQEIRNVVFRGSFTDLVAELADSPEFEGVVWSGSMKASTMQEYVLKFFAYRDNYSSFKHSVKDFLQDYTKEKTAEFKRNPELEQEYRDRFIRTFSEVARHFPGKIKRTQRQTPVNLYEAIVVAASFIIENDASITATAESVLKDEFLKELTTGYTNSPEAVRGRISRAYELMTGGQWMANG